MKHTLIILILFIMLTQESVPKFEGKWKEVKREWVSGRTTDAFGDLFTPLYELNINVKEKKVHINFAGVVERESSFIVENDSIIYFDNTRFILNKLTTEEMVLREWPMENPEDPTAHLLFFKSIK